MKKFLSLLLFGFFTFSIFAADQSQTSPLISLQGIGNIKLQPDRADIQFQVVTEGKDLSLASQENRKIMAQVDKTVTTLKISKENIKTTEYYINKVPQMMNNTTTYTYEVRNGFIVTVENLDKVPEIISAFEKAGVNNISGLTFYSSRESENLSNAMILAYKDAYSKGLAVAKAAGFNKISPNEINYDYFSPRRNMPYNLDATLMKSSLQIYTPQALDFTVNMRGSFKMEN